MSIADDARAKLEGITPGRWKYSDIIDGLHNVISEMGWDVARCSDGGSGQGDRPRRETIAIRNAEFIAAAPDLVRGLLAELDQAIAPDPCDMTHREPFDFAQCRTHDTTFPLGEKCKFDGREPWAVFADEADEQRQLKVRAELSLDRTRGELDAALATTQKVRELADEWERDEAYACGNPSECVRCVSFQRAVIALRRTLGGES
ncbi:hypothetical protein SEA_NORVS_97 [Gordonia phage Norvs]|nr:hypothetical protein SEA_NORVS_97 [Gordonia phage Norvs]